MPKKISAKNQDFENLKSKYNEISKEINILQIEICNKDEQRNIILDKIRNIQNSNNSKLNFNLLLDVNSNNNISDNSNENVELSSANDIVNNNMIKNSSFLSLDKIVIKKPLRKTDMETDDDDSVDISGENSSSDE
tara:strand:+ start:4148 stop:4555 length:408 start_codon:yes stop_codon:yes gene_type:complete